jgi:hypothetical protein
MGYPQSATSAARPRSGIATALGILAGTLGLLGLLLLTLGVIGLANVATPNMQGFNPGQSIDIRDSGMSVYARSDAVREQTVCTADGPSGQVVFERPVSSYSVDVAGSDFFEIARSPQDMPAGTYQVTCQGTEDAVYAGPYAPDTTASGLFGPLGLVLGLALLGLALLLALTAFLARGRRPRTTSPSAYGPGQEQYPYAAPSTLPGQAPPSGQAPPPYADYLRPRTDDPYAPPPPTGHPYGYVPPAAEPTQPVPYGQGAWAAQPPPPSADVTGQGRRQDPTEHVTAPPPSQAPQGPAAAPGEEPPVEGDPRPPTTSGNGYGADEDDDTPSGGLGYGPPWAPPTGPR